MRKTFCFTALLMGMVTFCFTLVKSWEYVTQVIIASNRLAAVLDYWRKVMLLPGCAALAVTACAAVLLIRLRGKGTQPNGYAGILIGSGGLLALMAFLLAWNEYLQIKQLDFTFNLTSSVSYQPYYYVAGSDVESGMKLGFLYFFDRYQWMAVLGAALIMAGILVGGFAKRNLPREKEYAEPAVPAPEEPVSVTEQTEWRIQLYCTVMDIRGDYALIKYDDTGVESEVAIALLPFGIDTGDRLKYENYEFSQI